MVMISISIMEITNIYGALSVYHALCQSLQLHYCIYSQQQP